jgi:hypothetical protein
MLGYRLFWVMWNFKIINLPNGGSPADASNLLTGLSRYVLTSEDDHGVKSKMGRI